MKKKKNDVPLGFFFTNFIGHALIAASLSFANCLSALPLLFRLPINHHTVTK